MGFFQSNCYFQVVQALENIFKPFAIDTYFSLFQAPLQLLCPLIHILINKAIFIPVLIDSLPQGVEACSDLFYHSYLLLAQFLLFTLFVTSNRLYLSSFSCLWQDWSAHRGAGAQAMPALHQNEMTRDRPLQRGMIIFSLGDPGLHWRGQQMSFLL